MVNQPTARSTFIVSKRARHHCFAYMNKTNSSFNILNPFQYTNKDKYKKGDNECLKRLSSLLKRKLHAIPDTVEMS